MTRKLLFSIACTALLVAFVLPTMVITAFAADSNTVSSTVVTDKSVPTASAPSVVVNNNDVCKSAAAVSVQTQVLGIATGVTITDENCERIKLARSLYGMGMKVAAVSTLCRDHRVFDAMWMSASFCPYMGSIGEDAKQGWLDNKHMVPKGSQVFANLAKEEEKETEFTPSPEEYTTLIESENKIRQDSSALFTNIYNMRCVVDYKSILNKMDNIKSTLIKKMKE